jgi:hypothetical protein
MLKEGSLNRETFLLGNVDDEETLAHKKGSARYLEAASELLIREESANYVL